MENRATSNPGRFFLDVTLIAGEVISIRNAVYIELAGGSGTAGCIYNCDSSTTGKSGSCWFAGFALNSAVAGAGVRVRLVGIVNGFSGLTVGASYFASTSGSITPTLNSSIASLILPVGVAVSSSSIMVTSRSIQSIAGPGGSFKGYIAGGCSTTSTAVTAVCNELTFSTNTFAAQASANLSQARIAIGSGISDVTDAKGYWAGGGTTAPVNTADKITYSNDTTAAQSSANLSTVRRGGAGVSDNADGKGYWAGGNSPTIVATADKVTYSNDTTASQSSANLSVSRFDLAGTSDNADGKGYFTGGSTSTTTLNAVVTTDKITYSNDTTAAQPSANISLGIGGVSGMADTQDGRSYLGGGNAGATVRPAVLRIAWATDVLANTNAVTGSTFTVTQYGCISDSVDGKGYYCGGTTSTSASGGAVGVRTAWMLTFSTETITSLGTSALSAQKWGASGISALNT